MASSFATSTFPETTEVSPFTSIPPVSPSSWAHSASSAESLLPTPTTQFAYTTFLSVSNGASRYYEVPITASASPTSSSDSSSGSDGKTTVLLDVLLSVLLPVVIIGAIVILALYYRRKRQVRRKQAWRMRYPSQWSWDAKYHDAEPEPTPLEPTASGSAADAQYAFAPSPAAPSNAQFPNSDLPRSPRRPPQSLHGRDRSI